MVTKVQEGASLERAARAKVRQASGVSKIGEQASETGESMM